MNLEPAQGTEANKTRPPIVVSNFGRRLGLVGRTTLRRIEDAIRLHLAL